MRALGSSSSQRPSGRTATTKYISTSERSAEEAFGEVEDGHLYKDLSGQWERNAGTSPFISPCPVRRGPPPLSVSHSHQNNPPSAASSPSLLTFIGIPNIIQDQTPNHHRISLFLLFISSLPPHRPFSPYFATFFSLFQLRPLRFTAMYITTVCIHLLLRHSYTNWTHVRSGRKRGL